MPTDPTPRIALFGPDFCNWLTTFTGVGSFALIGWGHTQVAIYLILVAILGQLMRIKS